MFEAFHPRAAVACSLSRTDVCCLCLVSVPFMAAGVTRATAAPAARFHIAATTTIRARLRHTQVGQGRTRSARVWPATGRSSRKLSQRSARRSTARSTSTRLAVAQLTGTTTRLGGHVRFCLFLSNRANAIANRHRHCLHATAFLTNIVWGLS